MNQTTALPGLFRIFYLESRYYVLSMLRTPAFSIPTVAFPVMFYVFFGLIFGRGGGGLHMPSYLLATYGTFGIMAPALFGFGVAVALERSQGWLRLKQASAMPPMAYLVSKLVMAMIFAAVVVLLLFALGAAFGNVQLARWQWFALFGILVLGTIPFCALGLWIGTVAQGQAAVPIVNLIYLPMAFLSGLWVPIQFFPELLQKVALVFPAYHLSQLGLGVIGMASDKRVWLQVAVLAGYVVVFLTLAVRNFYRHED